MTTNAILPQNAATAAGYYTVQAGETLFGVALRLGLTRQELAGANGLGEEDLLLIGQKLIIPSPNAASRAALLPTPTPIAGRFYTVESGDTIITIALANGVDWQEVLKLNGLQDDSFLQIGQKIRLPGEKPPGEGHPARARRRETSRLPGVACVGRGQGGGPCRPAPPSPPPGNCAQPRTPL